ncbi:unnamed protein product [Sympodiomycopsis kandeliae]
MVIQCHSIVQIRLNFQKSLVVLIRRIELAAILIDIAITQSDSQDMVRSKRILVLTGQLIMISQTLAVNTNMNPNSNSN